LTARTVAALSGGQLPSLRASKPRSSQYGTLALDARDLGEERIDVNIPIISRRYPKRLVIHRTRVVVGKEEPDASSPTR